MKPFKLGNHVLHSGTRLVKSTWAAARQPMAITSPDELRKFIDFRLEQLLAGSNQQPRAWCASAAQVWLYGLGRWQVRLSSADYQRLVPVAQSWWECQCAPWWQDEHNRLWQLGLVREFFYSSRRPLDNRLEHIADQLYDWIYPWLDDCQPGVVRLWVRQLAEHWNERVSDTNIMRSLLLQASRQSPPARQDWRV